MKTPLAGFRKLFEPHIVVRGRDYFNAGHVLDIDAYATGAYSVMVAGTEVYYVEVELDNAGNIQRLSCDCPYELPCKHMVAALLAIQEGRVQQTSAETPSPDMVKSNKSTLKTLLGGLSKELLIEELCHIAARHPGVKAQLLLRLGRRPTTPDEGRAYIRNAVTGAASRRYGLDSELVCHALEIALETAKTMEGLEAAAMLAMVISETCDILSEAYNHDDYLMEVFFDCINTLAGAAEIAALANKSYRIAFFNLLFDAALKAAPWDDTLMEQCVRFCGLP